MPLYGRLSYEHWIGAKSDAEERQEERDRARYDAMLDGKQDEADEALAELIITEVDELYLVVWDEQMLLDRVLGALDDRRVPYDEKAVARLLFTITYPHNEAIVRRVSLVNSLFASPRYTDAGRVRDAIAVLTETPSWEAWRETCAGES